MNIFELLRISYFNINLWMAIGVIIGIVAHLSDRRQAAGGWLFTTFFAISGAVMGGLATRLFVTKSMVEFSLPGLIIALVFSVIMAVFYRSSFRHNGHIRILR
jgi:uncharacterized membrane protein YeaQ/YmgE (transglycosylase-associated protein family)